MKNPKRRRATLAAALQIQVNLMGVEVAGFEVIETEKKVATEQPK